MAHNDRIEWIRHDDGVIELHLARADKMNALDPAMFDAIVDAGERLQHEPDLRAVVLAGRGKAFCAGLDMQSFARMAQAAGEGTASALIGGANAGADLLERTHGIANIAQQVAMIWRDVPVPVIAAVHGVAFGGGLQIALGADVRLIAPDARMSVMEIKWGLVPDMAGLVLMRGLVRDDVARELTYTGRIFGGEEAVAMGLATRVCADPRAEALALAAEIASKNPHAIRAGKRLLNLMGEGDQPAILLAESQEQGALIGSANQVEAVMANLQKRAAQYAD